MWIYGIEEKSTLTWGSRLMERIYPTRNKRRPITVTETKSSELLSSLREILKSDRLFSAIENSVLCLFIQHSPRSTRINKLRKRERGKSIKHLMDLWMPLTSPIQPACTSCIYARPSWPFPQCRAPAAHWRVNPFCKVKSSYRCWVYMVEWSRESLKRTRKVDTL